MSKVVALALKYKKAIAGFVVPGAVTLVAAMQSGSDGGSSVTGAEWVAIVAACFGTSVVVGTVRNGKKPPAA